MYLVTVILIRKLIQNCIPYCIRLGYRDVEVIKLIKLI